MKKKIVAFIVSLAALAACIYGFSACQGGINPSGSANSSSVESGINFNTFVVSGTSVYGSVSNSTTEFSFVDEIATSGKASFTVAKDKYGLQTYFTKIVPLEVGDNTFFVFETDNDKIINTYTVTIRRRPMYTVTFNTNGGTEVEAQTVEEGGYAFEPETAKEGLIFIGWNYNFALPILGNIEITAKYEAKEGLEFFEYTSIEGNITITGVRDKTVTKFVVPDCVTEIAEGAFAGCRNLTEITLPFVGATKDAKKNAHFGYIFGADNYDGGDKTEQYLVDLSTNKVTTVTYYIPHSLKKVTITSEDIPNCSFAGCSELRNIIITGSVSSVGDGAFAMCASLTSVEINSDVTSIGRAAFAYCNSLTNWVIPNSVTSISDALFYECVALTNVVIPDSVTSIGSEAFRGCGSLTSLVIPDSVTSIGERVFYSCGGLTSLVIGNIVTSIGEDAFYGCDESIYYVKDGLKYLGNDSNPCVYLTGVENKDITTVTIDSRCIYICDYAFWGCYNLSSVLIPDKVISVGRGVFSGCTALTSVVIPDSVRTIGWYAFYGCRNLTGVTIPDGVTNIGDYAFMYCNSLTIYCEAESKPSTWNNDWNNSDCPVVWGYQE